MNRAKLCAGLMYALLIIWIALEIVSNYQNYDMALLRIPLIACLGIMAIWLIRFVNYLDHQLHIHKEQLVAIRHDVRSPIIGINKIARVMRDQVNDHELKRLISLIIHSTDQLSIRVNDRHV